MKNLRLEFIRGVASLEVFINHLCANNAYLKTKTWTAVFANWATEAVILFFLLSGIVIHISQDKRHYHPVAFIINRFLRIYPSLIAGMILALIATVFVFQEPVLWTQYAANFFMLGTLQAYLVPSIKANPVIWSLSFEMFFYLVFALSILKKQKKWLLIWVIIAVISIPFYYKNYTGLPGHLFAMFAFSTIWLTGYFLYEYRSFLTIPDMKSALFFTSLLPLISRLHFSEVYYDVIKYFLFGIFAIPLFLYCVGAGKSNEKNYWQNVYLKILLALLLALVLFVNSRSLFISKVIYISGPVLMLLLSFLRWPAFPVLLQSFRFGGKFLGSVSYSLYIVHFPIILIVNHVIGETHYIVSIFVAVLIVFSIAWFLENVVQKKVLIQYRKAEQLFPSNAQQSI